MEKDLTHQLANNILVNSKNNIEEQKVLLTEIRSHNFYGMQGLSNFWQGIFWVCMLSKYQ